MSATIAIVAASAARVTVATSAMRLRTVNANSAATPRSPMISITLRAPPVG